MTLPDLGTDQLPAEAQPAFEATTVPIGCGVSSLGGAWGAVSENGRLRQGTGGPARGHRRSKGLELTMLLRINDARRFAVQRWRDSALSSAMTHLPP